jgi:hypothetical protein
LRFVFKQRVTASGLLINVLSENMKSLSLLCERSVNASVWRGFLMLLLSGSVGLSAEKASDWHPLFDGHDLENWTQNGSAKWIVKDGIILGGQDGDPKRAGLLATKDKFKNFELELEFMIDEHGKYNSGVYLRNNPDTPGRTGYQVNIGRPEAQEFMGLYTDHWLAKGDENDAIRKKLDWNKLFISSRTADTSKPG